MFFSHGAVFVSVGSSDHTPSFFGDCCCNFGEIAQWIMLILPDKQMLNNRQNV